MSDSTLNKWLAEGDDTAEAAFTPDPPGSPPTPEGAHLWVNKEDPVLPVLKWWDGANFIPVAAGRIVQVVHTQTGEVATGTTQMPFDNSIPQNTEGDEYMTLAITPTNASNILLIDVNIFATSTTTPWISVALFQDSTADALAATARFTTTATAGGDTTLRHKMVAGTTSSTTFKVRIGPSNAATISFNGASGTRIFGGVMASSITITEIQV